MVDMLWKKASTISGENVILLHTGNTDIKNGVGSALIPVKLKFASFLKWVVIIDIWCEIESRGI